jgi:TRAP transporter TAXI family solute receptor
MSSLSSRLAVFRKNHLTVMGPAILLVLLGFWIAYQFVEPAPPTKVVITAGDEAGAYYAFAQQYRNILARDGITLDVRASAGSVENLERLAVAESDVDLAFVQGGTRRSSDPQTLESLGSLFYEPLWVFYRGKVPLTRLTELRGKRIAVGQEGSGTQSVTLRLLEENGVRGAPTIVLPLGGDEATNALLGGRVDAAFFIASSQASTVQKLLRARGIKLMSFARAQAYIRRYRHVSSVVLPQGTIDLERNIPHLDTTLLAVTANLVAREDFHPALVYLLLKATTEVHGHADLFARAGEFPAPEYLEFPPNKEASRYYKQGPSLLYRFFPFWIANFIERMRVMLIPLFTLFLPFFKLVPPVYRWRVRSRIYRWYRDVQAIDLETSGQRVPEQLRSLLDRLDDIEKEVDKISPPLAYTDQLYNLRSHINLVREKIGRVFPHLSTRTRNSEG